MNKHNPRYKGERVKTTARIPKDDLQNIKEMADSLNLPVFDYLIFAHNRLRESGFLQQPISEPAPRNRSEVLFDPQLVPAIDSLWRHRNGNVYIVQEYSNGLNTHKYPLNILHRNIVNGLLYNRTMADWPRSFTQIKRGDFVRKVPDWPGMFIIDIPGLKSWPMIPLTEDEENAWHIAEGAMIDAIKEHLDDLKTNARQLAVATNT